MRSAQCGGRWMEVARAGRTAGQARRRARRAAPDEDRERLNAAFASIVKLVKGVSKECEKYYGTTAANKCKDNEIQHFCKYHGKKIERKVILPEEQRTEASIEPSQTQTFQQRSRRPSKDFYIEVSPGTYSVTAISEDMKQTHIIDVNAGQSIDLTFVL